MGVLWGCFYVSLELDLTEVAQCLSTEEGSEEQSPDAQVMRCAEK